MIRVAGLVLTAGLLFAWLLLELSDGLTTEDVLSGLAVLAAGVVAGALWPGLQQRAAGALAAAVDLLGEGESTGAFGEGEGEGAGEGPAGAWSERPAEGDPDSVDPSAPPATLNALLEGLKEFLGATRVVLWRTDDLGDRLFPEDGTRPLPEPLPAAGSPLSWALRERSAVRLDPVPGWARGAAVVVPVDGLRVLTVETAGDQPPDPGPLQQSVSLLGPFLRLHDQQAHVVAAGQRFDRLVEYLRWLPRERDPGLLPAGLARTAMEVVGGRGALVASWTGDEGQVLVREGTGGGPRPGSRFAVLEGDLAHAARAQSTLVREPGGARWPDLASGDERWDRPPPAYRVVFPLVDPRGATTGLVAVWGRARPAPQGIALLDAVAPLLALQLRQAGDMEQLLERATIDALTGLANRPALEERLAEERARYHRHRRPVALLVVDLDHFKDVNDNHGHDAGDAVLQRVGEVLHATVRDVDFPARFGGEEFVVLLPETQLAAALDVAERVRAAIEACVVRVGPTSIAPTASVGASACPDCVDDPGDLFGSADQALYAAKNAGRNRVAAAPTRVHSGGAGG